MEDLVDIPEEIKQFLLRNIDSVAQWEGLLVLLADSGREWTAAAVARKLYIGEPEAAQLLGQLAGRDIVAIKSEPETFYRYRPGSPELSELIGRAADFYRLHLIPMTRFIHSKPRNRVQEFADAFKLRKE
jgi:hypothetical protein